MLTLTRELVHAQINEIKRQRRTTSVGGRRNGRLTR